jgi:hypothetical protein
MFDKIIIDVTEEDGLQVTRYKTMLARGLTAFSNQQCAATLMAKNGSSPYITRASHSLPQDGNTQRSKFFGKTIRALQSDNPRREGTKGHKSYQILLAWGGCVSYDIYRLQGGRPNDLQWDLDHGYAEIV